MSCKILSVFSTPSRTFSCGLCLSQFHSRLLLADHFDEHFSHGKCDDCDQQLVLISGEFYFIQLHSVTNCKVKAQERSYKLDDGGSAKLENISNETVIKEEMVFEETFSNEMETNEGDQSIGSSFSTGGNTAVKNELFESENQNLNILPNEYTWNDVEHQHKKETSLCPKRNKRKPPVKTTKPSKKAKSQRLKQQTEPKGPEKSTHKPEPKLYCDICGKQYTIARYLEIHKREHTIFKVPMAILTDGIPQRQFQCDFCKKFFLTKLSVKTHLHLYHIDKELTAAKRQKNKKTVICDVCKKPYKSDHALKIHMEYHTNKTNFVCSYCGKGFRSGFHMKDHINGHTGQKPYQCQMCDKTFGRRSLLVSHQRVHTGEKPYKCTQEDCDRAFAYKIDMKRHLWGQHKIYTKKFECPMCQKIFPENKLLTKHLTSH